MKKLVARIKRRIEERRLMLLQTLMSPNHKPVPYDLGKLSKADHRLVEGVRKVLSEEDLTPAGLGFTRADLQDKPNA